jgi:hypothetical protein
MVCYYVHFKETAGGGLSAGEIVGAFMNAGSYSDSMCKQDGDGAVADYGVLEVNESDYNTMVANKSGSGTWGKHVDDPTGTPTLASGDPS